MTITKLDAASMSRSRWSGGTTTQLSIFPPDAVYADRDFMWRISSAVVELPESDFTPLPDYNRILMILDGELALSHDGGEEYLLRPLEQTHFDGASHTFSRGQVTDFNLMMRKGCCSGQVETLKVAGECSHILPESFSDTLFFCVCGGVTLTAPDGTRESLSAGDALLIHGHCGAAVTLTGEATLIRADTVCGAGTIDTQR